MDFDIYATKSACMATVLSALLLCHPFFVEADMSADKSGHDLLTVASNSHGPAARACLEEEEREADSDGSFWQKSALVELPRKEMAGGNAATDDREANESGTAGEKRGGFQKDWPWRRASIGELAGITVAAAGTLYSEAAYGEPKHADWSSHNGFDEGIRNALRLRDRSAQNAVGTFGDGLMGVLIAEPIVDSFITLGYRDRRWDALWQTSVINLESFTFTAFISSVMQNSIKRERPFQRDCPDGSCVGEQPNSSMPSGHVAFAFTGAGLYCTHHDYLSTYDPTTERTLCYTSLGLAAVDGVARIVADRHYATDVLAGSALGLFSGFVLPRLLHYYWADNDGGSHRAKGGEEASFLQRISLSPQISNGGGSFSCSVAF